MFVRTRKIGFAYLKSYFCNAYDDRAPCEATVTKILTDESFFAKNKQIKVFSWR
jgi:hypothetical protein